MYVRLIVMSSILTRRISPEREREREREEEEIFIASAKGRYGFKQTPTPQHNSHEKNSKRTTEKVNF